MIGADVVDIKRIARAIQSEHFLTSVFTQSERLYAQAKHNPQETLAGIFAAKEAVAKLSGKGVRGYRLTDIEILHTHLGAPEVVLYGKAKELFFGEVFVSISHEKDYAFAVATTIRQSFGPVLPGKEITDGDFELFRRERFTHKGDYGRVYVMGGSPHMIGAPLLTAEAAARSGAGLTTLCVPKSLLGAYQSRVKEIMLFGVSDLDGIVNFDEQALAVIASKADVIVMGMGMGNNPRLPEIINNLFLHFGGTLVCDADAINAISYNPELLDVERKCTLVLTPHVGEFDRLKRAVGVDEVQDCALKIGAIIACKSAHTVVSDGITTYKVTSGHAAMAKGGSGDALAGIIGAYLCRTVALDATVLACHYFGRCGERAAQNKGENAVIASDVISYL